ncbi:HAD-IA family hydrolase [bacterium]|nr:HAD-IA family hydrolase [bacterium]
MSRYSAVIFDLDGTLLDTLADLTDAVNYALNLHGFPTRTLAEIRAFVGNGVANLISRAIPDGRSNPSFDQCLADFRKYYSAHMECKTAAYEGIIDLLAYLAGHNYRTAIVSNKFDAAVKQLSEQYFGSYIQVTIGESAGVTKKPAPDTVIKAMAELGATPEHTIYVGDSEVDVATAKNAGLPCVGVTWGFRDREVLQSLGTDYIINTPQELLAIIED